MIAVWFDWKNNPSDPFWFWDSHYIFPGLGQLIPTFYYLSSLQSPRHFTLHVHTVTSSLIHQFFIRNARRGDCQCRPYFGNHHSSQLLETPWRFQLTLVGLMCRLAFFAVCFHTYVDYFYVQTFSTSVISNLRPI